MRIVEIMWHYVKMPATILKLASRILLQTINKLKFGKAWELAQSVKYLSIQAQRYVFYL